MQSLCVVHVRIRKRCALVMQASYAIFLANPNDVVNTIYSQLGALRIRVLVYAYADACDCVHVYIYDRLC